MGVTRIPEGDGSAAMESGACGESSEAKREGRGLSSEVWETETRPGPPRIGKGMEIELKGTGPGKGLPEGWRCSPRSEKPRGPDSRAQWALRFAGIWGTAFPAPPVGSCSWLCRTQESRETEPSRVRCEGNDTHTNTLTSSHSHPHLHAHTPACHKANSVGREALAGTFGPG